jgi:hypothetical protein
MVVGILAGPEGQDLPWSGKVQFFDLGEKVDADGDRSVGHTDSLSGSRRGGAMPDHRNEEELTEKEIEKDAAREREDPVTSREALEEELMDEGRSDAGEHIPDS